MIIESQAIATKRTQEGYTYQQERGFDVASQVAQNEAIGQYTNLGVGLGTMAGVGGTVSSIMKDAISGTQSKNNNTSTKSCPKCGCILQNNAKFCLECGEKVDVENNQNTIKCPQCGNYVSRGKFCLECGFKFVVKCPTCGEEMQNAKFCSNCGQKL